MRTSLAISVDSKYLCVLSFSSGGCCYTMGRICIRRTIQRICGLLPLQVQFLFWFPRKGKLGAGKSNHHEIGGGRGGGGLLVKEVLTLYENLLLTFLVFPHSQ
jgi:hypothetical protein